MRPRARGSSGSRRYRIENWAKLPACHLGPGPALGAARAGRARSREAGEVRGHRGHPRHRYPGGDRVPARPHARPPRCRSRSPAPCAPRATRAGTARATCWTPRRSRRAPASAGRGAMVVFARAGLRRRHGGEDPRHRPRRVLGAARRADRAGGGRPGDVLRRSRPARAAPLAARRRSTPGSRCVPLGGGRRRDHARPARGPSTTAWWSRRSAAATCLPARCRPFGAGSTRGSRSCWPAAAAAGEVTPVYAFEGGGARTVAMGAIPAGPRTPSQARMELAHRALGRRAVRRRR